MTGSLGHLAAAAAFLLVSHFGVSSTGLRSMLIRRIGRGTYLTLYSLVAVAALVWLILAYAAAPYRGLWSFAAWQWLVPLAVMPVAFLLLVAGVSTPGPTAVGREGLLSAPEPARGILRVTRNPVMWAIGLWAIAHLFPNGDVASLLFFGSLGALALIGTVLIDHRIAAQKPEAWAAFAGKTSNLPLLAVVQGRQRLVWSEIGWHRLAVALALFLVLLVLHRWLFGISALPLPE